MSLRLKLHLIVGGLSLLFVAAVLTLQFDALRQSVQEEVVAANRVAAQLLNRTAILYAGQGTPGMLSFLQGLGRVRSTEITLVDAGLHTLYRSPPSPYKAGRFDISLPPLPGREAAAIGSAFNRMLGVLRENIETEKRAVHAETQLSESRELTQWLDHHVEQERRLIARELHDELGQSVTAMRSMALSVAQRVQASDPESAQAARLIADEASHLYDAMHGLIPRLTPLVLDRFGLADALTDLADRTRHSQPQLQVDLDLESGDAALATDVALALYRAAQEGITNALRHGAADRLRLKLWRDGAEMVLIVEDDGRGLAPDWSERPGHHGLRWMAERVHALHGRFDIGPAHPHGVLLSIAVPIGPAATATPAAATLASMPGAA